MNINQLIPTKKPGELDHQGIRLRSGSLKLSSVYRKRSSKTPSKKQKEARNYGNQERPDVKPSANMETATLEGVTVRDEEAQLLVDVVARDSRDLQIMTKTVASLVNTVKTLETHLKDTQETSKADLQTVIDEYDGRITQMREEINQVREAEETAWEERANAEKEELERQTEEKLRLLREAYEDELRQTRELLRTNQAGRNTPPLGNHARVQTAPSPTGNPREQMMPPQMEMTSGGNLLNEQNLAHLLDNVGIAENQENHYANVRRNNKRARLYPTPPISPLQRMNESPTLPPQDQHFLRQQLPGLYNRKIPNDLISFERIHRFDGGPDQDVDRFIASCQLRLSNMDLTAAEELEVVRTALRGPALQVMDQIQRNNPRATFSDFAELLSERFNSTQTQDAARETLRERRLRRSDHPQQYLADLQRLASQAFPGDAKLQSHMVYDQFFNGLTPDMAMMVRNDPRLMEGRKDHHILLAALSRTKIALDKSVQENGVATTYKLYQEEEPKQAKQNRPERNPRKHKAPREHSPEQAANAVQAYGIGQRNDRNPHAKAYKLAEAPEQNSAAPSAAYQIPTDDILKIVQEMIVSALRNFQQAQNQHQSQPYYYPNPPTPNTPAVVLPGPGKSR